MSLVRNEKRSVWPMDPLWSEERVDRVFRDMWRDFFGGTALADRFGDGRASSMRLEEFVEDGTCVIRAELPAVDPAKDIDIVVEDGMLRLRAHREERTEDKRPDGYRTEFHYGSLQRSIRLPEGVNTDDIKATYKDGILEVRVPMPAPVKAPPESTKIEVTRS